MDISRIDFGFTNFENRIRKLFEEKECNYPWRSQEFLSYGQFPAQFF